MEEIDNVYVKDEAFWNKYMKGRPQIPDSLFQRICEYHSGHGGQFDVVHDVGAGAGVHSHRLAKIFDHVVISDVAKSNVDIAQERLGTEKYSYRVAKVEDADDMDEGSVDMVFAGFVMHFVDFDQGFKAIAKQLKPGGTFVAFTCSRLVSHDPRVEEICRGIVWEGMRVLLRQASDRKERLHSLGKIARGYDVMPVDEKYFRPGALRITLNDHDDWPDMIPPDVRAEFESTFGSGTGIGSNDQIINEDEPGWTFKGGYQDLRDHFATVPFTTLEPETFSSMFTELEQILSDGKTIEGHYALGFVTKASVSHPVVSLRRQSGAQSTVFNYSSPRV